MTVTCTADAAPIICQSGLGEASLIQEHLLTVRPVAKESLCHLGISNAAKTSLY